jgi:FkbM family methyltransferase
MHSVVFSALPVPFKVAALLSGAALVIAIEPVPENAACLRRTFANEVAANRVVVVEAGVWDRHGTLTLQMDPRNSWGAHVVEARPEVGWLATQVSKQVRLVPIDDLTEDLRLPKVDFIKMDIEGSERRALDGAKKTIARWRPRMAICVYHRPDDLQEVSRRVPWWYLKLPGHCEDHGTSIKREVLLFY